MGTGEPKAGDGESEPTRPPGQVILIVSGIVLVAAIAVAALVAANRDAATFTEGSPEAVVQGYLEAMISGDEAEAHRYLSADLRSECSVGDLRGERLDDTRVTLRSVTVDGDAAEVEVSITESAGDLFGGGYTFDEAFVLARSGSVWVIDEPPWPVFFCTN